LDLALIDEMAANGNTSLHATPTGVKLAASGLLLAATIVAATPASVAAVCGAALALAAATRQPVRRLVAIAAYPVLFAGIFALGWVRTNPAFATVIVIRAFSAGFAAALFITTTTFVDAFSLISRVLPGPVGDGLFLAYRAFFLLLTELGQVVQAIRLRGGAGLGLGTQLRTYGEALGVVVLHAADMTERMYKMMLVRGYSGRIESSRPARPMAAFHYALLAYCAAVLTAAIAARRFSS
jgi:cobalt/nickel transport system permease protein